MQASGEHAIAAADVVISYPEYRAAAPADDRPAQEVVTSYLNQVVRFSTPDGRLADVIPTQPDTSPAPGEPPDAAVATTFLFESAIHILGYWSPDGVRATREVNEAGREGAQRLATAHGIETRPAATFARDGCWAEPALLLIDATDDIAAAMARELGQPAVTRWNERGLTVLPADGTAPPSETRSCHWRTMTTPTCPMLCGAAQGQYCRTRGGPWVGASMHAALFFQAHRSLMTSLLGCGTCDDGTARLPDTKGTPIAIVDLYVPSRYRGWTTA